MSEILDLDSIMPQPATLKYLGKEITINPPTVAQILTLIRFNSDLMDTDDTDFEAMTQAAAKVEAQIRKIIPELPEGQLNAYAQRTIIELLLKLSKPEEVKELEDKGIKVDDSKKAP